MRGPGERAEAVRQRGRAAWCGAGSRRGRPAPAAGCGAPPPVLATVDIEHPINYGGSYPIERVCRVGRAAAAAARARRRAARRARRVHGRVHIVSSCAAWRETGSRYR